MFNFVTLIITHKASITSQMALMQTLGITGCPVESHLLPFLVKVKKMLVQRPSQLHGNQHQSCQGWHGMRT